MMRREEALDLVRKRVRNDKLVKHMLAVEAIMRGLARRLGESEEEWALAGLLHDIDYEETKDDWSKHALVAAEILRNLDVPESVIDAIRNHNEYAGGNPQTKIAKALIAADQASGLIVATALVMPNKKLEEVKLSSLLRKFKQKDFARGVDREKIRKYSEELGLSLEEFLEIALSSMREIASDLGL